MVTGRGGGGGGFVAERTIHFSSRLHPLLGRRWWAPLVVWTWLVEVKRHLDWTGAVRDSTVIQRVVQLPSVRRLLQGAGGVCAVGCSETFMQNIRVQHSAHRGFRISQYTYYCDPTDPQLMCGLMVCVHCTN